MGSAANVLPREDLDTFLAVASQPKHQESMLAEFSQHCFYFGPHSEVPRTLGDTPLVVVTAGNSVSGKGKFGGMTIDQLNAHHQGWQKDLLQLSSQSEQIILPGPPTCPSSPSRSMPPRWWGQSAAWWRKLSPIDKSPQRLYS